MKISNYTIFLVAILLLASGSMGVAHAQDKPATRTGYLVGTQYDTTHVYVDPDKMDALVNSFIATFGGHATTKIVTNVLPVPSRTESQAVLTPAGNLSVFAFLTPVPFPFGQERNGYLVRDMDQAIQTAAKAGAEVIVAPFQDPIGRDAVVQWPGGLKMQFYWHTAPPSSAPLLSVPESRIYVSPDQVDACVHAIIRFSQGKVISDDQKADAGEIGRPGTVFRRIRIDSGFGTMLMLVTDGHLPYPFGYERTGYQVTDVTSTVTRAVSAGAQVLWGPQDAPDRTTAILEFPGGYIAEVHMPKQR